MIKTEAPRQRKDDRKEDKEGRSYLQAPEDSVSVYVVLRAAAVHHGRAGVALVSRRMAANTKTGLERGISPCNDAWRRASEADSSVAGKAAGRNKAGSVRVGAPISADNANSSFLGPETEEESTSCPPAATL